MTDYLSEEQKQKIAYKKASRKWLVAKYALVFMPLSIAGQVFLSYLGGPELPLNIIVGGCFALIGLYFGVNLAQKGVLNEKNPRNGG